MIWMRPNPSRSTSSPKPKRRAALPIGKWAGRIGAGATCRVGMFEAQHHARLDDMHRDLGSRDRVGRDRR